MPDDLAIAAERPDQRAVVALLDRLDAYLASLYAPEDNHILDVPALMAPEVTFLVARRGGDVVGCAAVRRMPGEAATGGMPYGEVKRMMVDPAHRGQRVGARLLAALERVLVADGIGLALLETGRDQHEALRLYERAGYTRCGAFAGYPDNGLSVFMRKALPAKGAA
ncbi:GNAT family N-acetyltransferase [Azohydromonas sediminis]|uniref:GNAT family N-acetyltransferase n=1 Tax=Azohydromonas sediminis TaxID=2259674 RepID=UPI000E65000F|nr:GNAT family N-acetyltransferase [Azohydromonas sediminis]